MKIGFEQLIWAFLIIMFLVLSIIKSMKQQQRAKTAATQKPAQRRRPRSPDDVERFLEELMGVERPREKPPIRYEEEEETARPRRPKPEPIVQEAPAEVARGGLGQLEGFEEYPVPEPPSAEEQPVKKPKYDLKKAIIFSEIIGPPISKRKTHRLF